MELGGLLYVNTDLSWRGLYLYVCKDKLLAKGETVAEKHPSITRSQLE